MISAAPRLLFLVLLSVPTLLFPIIGAAQGYHYHQQNKGFFQLSVGAGAMVRPTYEGADSYTLSPLPYVDLKIGDNISLNPRTGLLYTFHPNRNLKFGAGIGANWGREEDADDFLRGMGDIDPTVEAKAFVKYSFGQFSTSATFSHDLLGTGHEGATLKGAVGYALPVPSYRTFIVPSASFTYASDQYMDSFFGVNSRQSAASGLPNYKASAGLKDISLSMTANTQITQQWSLTSMISFTHLLGDAADSPIVQDENAVSGGLFASYKF